MQSPWCREADGLWMGGTKLAGTFLPHFLCKFFLFNPTAVFFFLLHFTQFFLPVHYFLSIPIFSFSNLNILRSFITSLFYLTFSFYCFADLIWVMDTMWGEAKMPLWLFIYLLNRATLFCSVSEEEKFGHLDFTKFFNKIKNLFYITYCTF